MQVTLPKGDTRRYSHNTTNVYHVARTQSVVFVYSLILKITMFIVMQHILDI